MGWDVIGLNGTECDGMGDGICSERWMGYVMETCVSVSHLFFCARVCLLLVCVCVCVCVQTSAATRYTYGTVLSAVDVRPHSPPSPSFRIRL